jgi:Lrp/AsnC family transcriptional regulator for asnA, asnC and gidA
MAKMNPPTQIDDIDNKIIHALLQDARTPIKTIAEKCNISPVSIVNRIKRLKSLGIINGGAALLPNLSELKLPIVATIGINLKENFKDVIKIIEKNANLVQISRSIGKYDVIAVVHAENLSELDKIAFSIRRLSGVKKLEVSVWTSLPVWVFENIDLQPKRETQNG